jgi:hypothetical protein
MLALVASAELGVAATVSDGPDRVGKVTRVHSGLYKVSSRNREVGEVRQSTSDQWTVFRGGGKAGDVRKLTSTRWLIYDDGLRAGYVRKSGSQWLAFSDTLESLGHVDGGRGAPAAGATLLLLVD